jgi:PAT family beta-lactamase induction signal transducer AmpG
VLYVAVSSLLSGMVFIGLYSSLPFMLSEYKINPSKIALILTATLPYGWKFALSPFIKNVIIKFENARTDIIKILSFSLQFITIICFASIGYVASESGTLTLGILVLILCTSIASFDIVYGHVKLVTFKKEELGLITSIITTGFRIGVFISGAIMLYIAEATSWKFSFIVSSIFMALCSVVTAIIPRIPSDSSPLQTSLFSWKQYARILSDFFKKNNIVIFLMLAISLKFADSCISTMKPIFLQTYGISKIVFANITHIVGLFVTITSGFAAGYCVTKIGMIKSMKYAFIMQSIATALFIILSFGLPSTSILAIIINISTFSFGFTNVVYRTYAAEKANRDVNVFVLILSFGSLIRILAVNTGGFIVEHYSWLAVFLLSFLTNLPGFLAYSKLRFK